MASDWITLKQTMLEAHQGLHHP